jgi:hypothetical protein
VKNCRVRREAPVGGRGWTGRRKRGGEGLAAEQRREKISRERGDSENFNN